jgi:hypothetical protein
MIDRGNLLGVLIGLLQHGLIPFWTEHRVTSDFRDEKWRQKAGKSVNRGILD